MRALRISTPRLLLSILLALSLNLSPVSIYAQSESDTQEPTATQTITEPATIEGAGPSTAEPETGSSSPTGAEASSYTYNEITGKWENDYYIWDPVTHQTSPKIPQTYSYNTNTNMWDTTRWVYDAPSGTYKPNTTSQSASPSEPISMIDATKTLPQPASGTQQNTTASGSDSSNQAMTTTNTNGVFDLYYNARISNTIRSSAQSGNILVSQNTAAGGGTSGDTLSAATVINLLQSTWNPTMGGFTTFTADVNGDVVGDIVIDPGQLPSQNLAVKNQNSNMHINTYSDLDVENNIDLIAKSGDVALDSNTSVGDGTSGNALAMANVFNLINSAISSGDSFIGTVNINGTLDGDILFPPGFLEQVLAQNGSQASSTTGSAYDIDSTNTAAVNVENNVNAYARSGDVSADNNTSVGKLTSGTSDTSVTILNLTGRQVVGDNALLVFVHVLGKWVGMIMDAPSASSALVGGNTTSQTMAGSQNITTEDRIRLANNINVTAESGDVALTNNTEAGDGTSGDTSAVVHIANIANSQFSFSRWFGILFINIFGSWMGSFGVDTHAGDPIPPAAQKPSAPTLTNQHIRVFRLVTNSTQNSDITNVSRVQEPVQENTTHETNKDQTMVLATTDQQPPANPQDNENSNWVTAAALITLISLAIGGVLRQITTAVIRQRAA